ncbi:OmpA family protein [Clostridium sp. JN-9]|uniref:OmpA family protein n=1 Tax=Clostridium sp. JN-9 TaxID=2507159 RepID=UPI000FFE20D1|nr:OmpA family protein [Clostridium sp. JN-9]QAT38865.1 chemotaxis protein MotB [Clostridium sp. JN-9]
MKRKPKKSGNSQRWLLTYVDLITLLMIFFVVMYAMSNVNATKYSQLSNSLKVAMGGGKSIIGTSDAPSISNSTQAVDTAIVEQDKLENVKKQLDKYLKDNNMSNEATSKVEERGLVVSLNDTLFFDSAQAVIKPESQKKLIEMGKILNQLGNYIRIEGHTDNVPINNSEFSSNWQLSAIRATNVTELLINKAGIAPERLSSVGYGEYRPIADNSTEAGRAKNRRVDIIIMNTKYNQIENNKK